MKTPTSKYIAALAFAVALPVTAAAGPYVGVNYTRADLSGALDADFDTIAIKGGYEFTNWLALEARYGASFSDSSYRETFGPFTIRVKYQVEHYYGAYGRLTLPNSTLFKPYVIAGYTEAELKETAHVNDYKLGSSTIRGEAFSYGAGVNLEFSERFSVNAEYMRLIDKGDADLDGLTVGASYRF